jgi:L-aminopeptidase/D-esterase-like protein
VDFALGSVGGGYGATTVNLKGGLGSASALTPSGFGVGVLAGGQRDRLGGDWRRAAFLGCPV